MSPPDLRALNDSVRLAGPHRARPIRFLRTEQVRDWRLKVYTIATHGQTARPAFIDETLHRAAAIYADPPLDDGRHGVGFVIAHDAATACIALYYWWRWFNELHQRIVAGPKDDPRAMTPLPYQTAGCVWELEVINFERRAWLSDVLANPDGPDVARYLGRTTDADV